MPNYKKKVKVSWKVILYLCERQIHISVEDWKRLKLLEQVGFSIKLRVNILKEELEAYYELRNFLGYTYCKQIDKEYYKLYQELGWKWKYIKMKDFS